MTNLNLLQDAVHIWHTQLTYQKKKYPSFQYWLSTEEKERAANLASPYRRCFILARGLLRKLLSHYSGQTPEQLHLSTISSGKPLLRNCPFNQQIEFNLSHSQDRIIYAFTLNTPIGIDLEYKTARKYLDKIAYRFFPADDYQRLKQLSGKKKLNSFFNAWVKNEALLKMLGKQLCTHPLSQYKIASYNRLDKPKHNPYTEKKDTVYALSPLSIYPDFATAIAIQGNSKPLIVREYIPFVSENTHFLKLGRVPPDHKTDPSKA